MATRLDLLIAARNQTAAAFSEVRGDLDQLNNSAKMVSGGLMGMAAGVGIGAIANLGRAIFDLARDAQGVQALKSSFDDLVGSIGPTGPALLSALEGVSQGMISQQDLIMSANRAIMLGVTDSQAEMEQLMQVAITRGRAMGLSATQAFNDLVTGLGRMSPLILDNLGIVTGGEKVFQDYAKNLGKTAEALTDAEKKQALFNKVLAESQDIVAQGIEVNPFAKMDASLANLRLQAGQMFAPLAGQIAQAAADSMGSLSDYIKEGLESGLTNTGEQLGYSLGVALKDGIIAALTNGEAVRDALIGIVTNFNIGTAGVEVGKQLAAGTKQALEENAGEITAVWTAAFSPTKAQELAGDLAHIKELFEDLHSAQQLYAQYKSDGDYLRMDSMSNAIQRVIAELAPLQNKVREATAAMGPLNNATERNASSAWAAVTGWQNLGGATSGAAGAQTAVVGPINDTTAALKAQADQAAATATALQGVFMAAVSALGANSAFALSQNAQQELRGMEELWVRRGVDPNKIPFLRTEFLDNQQARLQYLIEAPQRAAEETERLNKYWFENATNVDRANRSVRNWRDTVNASLRNTEEGGKQNILPTARMGLDVGGGGSGGGGVSESEIEQMVGDLRGRVQGVLGNALNVDVGVNPADFLPREDAVNEDARRLADVMVRGFESPWYEFLTQKFPGMFDGAGDIKEKAAQIMRDFQQGLRPELIDKETVKEQVKRMILGEASMSALADEIASELAGELGVSLAKAKDAVGAVMGVQEGDTSGAGSAIADGFAQATNGERMVQGMVERMETAYSRLYQSGVKAGHQWGTGFMSVMQSGLSPALIELLATLVTPAVLAQMAANGSRTGAE